MLTRLLILSTCLMGLSTVDIRADDASIAQGKALYMGIGACFTCHGTKGKGDGPAAPGLNPKPRSFTDGAYLYDTNQDGKKGTRQDLKDIIVFGTAKYGGSPLMPPRPDLKGDNLEALIDFLETLLTKRTK